MKELLEHIVKSIVNTPDSVVIEEKESVDFPGLMILSIQVSDEDTGVVIGRKGRTINAIRDIITINAIRTNKRVKVLVNESEDSPRPRREVKQEEVTKEVDPVEQASTEDMLSDEL